MAEKVKYKITDIPMRPLHDELDALVFSKLAKGEKITTELAKLPDGYVFTFKRFKKIHAN